MRQHNKMETINNKAFVVSLDEICHGLERFVDHIFHLSN